MAWLIVWKIWKPSIDVCQIFKNCSFFCKMCSVCMRSSVTVLDEVLLNFYRNNCADCSGFKTIQNLKCLNSLWRFMHLFTKAWWTIPSGRFDFQALITPNLFQSVHRVIDLKIHCIIFLWPVKVAVMFTIFATWKWEKIRPSFPALLTTFWIQYVFLLKGVRLLVWGTKDINIGGSGLTYINFASLASQFKFMDIMKYHLLCLGSLANTLHNVEKMASKNSPFSL